MDYPNPLHNVDRIEASSYEEQTEVELHIGSEKFGVSVDALELSNPKKVGYKTHLRNDLYAKFENAMCKVHESDGYKILQCQEW